MDCCAVGNIVIDARTFSPELKKMFLESIEETGRTVEEDRGNLVVYMLELESTESLREFNTFLNNLAESRNIDKGEIKRREAITLFVEPGEDEHKIDDAAVVVAASKIYGGGYFPVPLKKSKVGDRNHVLFEGPRYLTREEREDESTTKTMPYYESVLIESGGKVAAASIECLRVDFRGEEMTAKFATTIYVFELFRTRDTNKLRCSCYADTYIDDFVVPENANNAIGIMEPFIANFDLRKYKNGVPEMQMAYANLCWGLEIEARNIALGIKKKIAEDETYVQPVVAKPRLELNFTVLHRSLIRQYESKGFSIEEEVKIKGRYNNLFDSSRPKKGAYVRVPAPTNVSKTPHGLTAINAPRVENVTLSPEAIARQNAHLDKQAEEKAKAKTGNIGEGIIPSVEPSPKAETAQIVAPQEPNKFYPFQQTKKKRRVETRKFWFKEIGFEIEFDVGSKEILLARCLALTEIAVRMLDEKAHIRDARHLFHSVDGLEEYYKNHPMGSAPKTSAPSKGEKEVSETTIFDDANSEAIIFAAKLD